MPDVPGYKLRHEVDVEQIRVVDERAEIQERLDHEKRRKQLIYFGEYREGLAEQVLKLLPDPETQSNPNWWWKLRRWVETHPYKADEIDYLVDVAKDPEKYGFPVSLEPEKTKTRGQHMRGKSLPDATKKRMSEAAKKRWAENRDTMLEAVRKGQKDRRETERERAEQEVADRSY